MFTLAYTVQEFLGTEFGSWLTTSLGIIGSAVISILVSKIRSKASQIAAQNTQLTEMSALVIRLSEKLETVGQMFAMVFLESKTLTPETKIAVANMAKTIITDVHSDAANLVDLALNKGRDALANQARNLMQQAEERASALIDKLTLEDPTNTA